jgi:hypothetical protein
LHVDVVAGAKNAEARDVSPTADAGVPELITVLGSAEVGTGDDPVALHKGGASQERSGGRVLSISLDVEEWPGGGCCTGRDEGTHAEHHLIGAEARGLLRGAAVAHGDPATHDIPLTVTCSLSAEFPEGGFDGLDAAFGETVSLWVIWCGCPMIDEVCQEKVLEGSLEFCPVVGEDLGAGPEAAEDVLLEGVGGDGRCLAADGDDLNPFCVMVDHDHDIRILPGGCGEGAAEVDAPSVHWAFDGQGM